MISVRSLLQQSNGNNFLFFLLFIFLLSSCDLFRPVQGTRDKNKEELEELDPIGGGKIYNPETGEYEDADEMLAGTLDTIRWRDVSTNDYPPITSDGSIIDGGNGETGGVIREGELGTKFLRSYNVSLLLPFLTDRFGGSEQNLDPNSRWAVQFYTGAKLAIEKLDREGINLKVSVYDTKASVLALNDAIQRDTGFIQSSHLLMGTVKGECVVRMAQYAKAQEIPFVSPFSASTGVTSDNPFYIQINPSLATHLREITEHAKANYNSDQIVVVTKKEASDENRRMQYIQQVNYELAGSTYAPRFEELVIEDNTQNLDRTDLSSVMRQGRATVFILPMWEDRAFIRAFLRKAYLASRSNPIVVYGMRQWQYFEDADYNYYENLKLHISSEYFVDDYMKTVREFKKNYFDQFGTIPSAEAFRGYDNMLYFGRMLNQHGTKFYEFFSQEKLNAFHTTYDIEPVARIEKNKYGQEIYGTPERYENQFVHILKFEDFYFQPAE